MCHRRVWPLERRNGEAKNSNGRSASEVLTRLETVIGMTSTIPPTQTSTNVAPGAFGCTLRPRNDAMSLSRTIALPASIVSGVPSTPTARIGSSCAESPTASQRPPRQSTKRRIGRQRSRKLSRSAPNEARTRASPRCSHATRPAADMCNGAPDTHWYRTPVMCRT